MSWANVKVGNLGQTSDPTVAEGCGVSRMPDVSRLLLLNRRTHHKGSSKSTFGLLMLKEGVLDNASDKRRTRKIGSQVTYLVGRSSRL